MLFTFATKIQCNRNSELLIYTLVLHHWVSQNRWLGKSIHGLCYKRPVRCHSRTKCSFHYFLFCIRLSRRILWNLPSSQTALSNGNQNKTGGKVLMHCFISSNCRSLPSHGIQISVMFKAWQNTTWTTQRMEPIGEYINIMGRTRYFFFFILQISGQSYKCHQPAGGKISRDALIKHSNQKEYQ